MNYVKHDGINKQVIFTLHGTGGSATDLFSIAQSISPLATLVGFQGEVYEQQMARYFARHLDGSFDLRSLAKATYDLRESLNNVIEKFDLKDHEIILLGYSNGANLALSYFKEFSNVPIDYALLFHPTTVRPKDQLQPQNRLQVLLTSGQQDPYMKPQQLEQIKQEFEEAQIPLEVFVHPLGHQLVQEELEASRSFLDKNDQTTL